METTFGIVYYTLTKSGGMEEINMNANLRKTPAGSLKLKWMDNNKTGIAEII